MFRSFRYTTALASGIFAGALALGACDQAPGPLDHTDSPPALSEFSFSPQEFIAPLGDDPADAVIPLSMEVTARDPDQDIAAVSFVVFGDTTLAEGLLDYGNGGRYTGRSDVTIPAGELGAYTVLVFAEDREGMLSNTVRGTLLVSGDGSPPVIHAVSAPDTLHRPAEGEDPVLLEIAAVVSDPDGLSNIAAVEFWNTERPGDRIAMLDDGVGGDAAAADGRYTRIVQIESSNNPGIVTFAFQARDRAGLLSNVAEAKTVVE